MKDRNPSWEWWYIPIIPAVWEAEARDFMFQVNLGNVRLKRLGT